MNLQMSLNVSGGINTQLNVGGGKESAGSSCDIYPDCICAYVSYTPVTNIFCREQLLILAYAAKKMVMSTPWWHDSTGERGTPI